MTINQTHFEIHLTVTSGDDTPVDLLASETGLSKQRIKQAMQKGAVWLTEKKGTRRIRRAGKVLKAGDSLHLYYDEKVLSMAPKSPLLITDAGAYSVWYKPGGMLSQGSKWGDHCTTSRWVEKNLKPQRPAFIVHRLDRAASGLILIAHEKRSAVALTKLFHDRLINKCYRVIVHGKFPAEAEPTKMNSDIDGREAESTATLLDYDETLDCSLLEVDIATGRKHQIRRHLAEINFPVLGDRLYGRNHDEADLQLTAYRLAFNCPLTNKPQHFELPENLLPSLSRLSEDKAVLNKPVLSKPVV